MGGFHDWKVFIYETNISYPKLLCTCTVGYCYFYLLKKAVGIMFELIGMRRMRRSVIAVLLAFMLVASFVPCSPNAMEASAAGSDPNPLNTYTAIESLPAGIAGTLTDDDELTFNTNYGTTTRNAKAYKVELSGGTTYTITNHSENGGVGFDACLYLLDSNGDYICYNDENNNVDFCLSKLGYGDAQIDITPNTTSTYYIVATSYFTSRTGGYVLSVFDKNTPKYSISGSVSGSITGESEGKLEDITVTVYKELAPGIYAKGKNTVSTNDDGSYTFQNLYPGNYKVQFADNSKTYAPEYYNDKVNLENADPIKLSNVATTGINAVLSEGGYISGIVTDEDDKDELLKNIRVYIYDSAETNMNIYSNYVDTNDEGEYDFAGLATGAYKLRFKDSKNNYLEEFWDDKSSLSDAGTIVVTAGAVTSGKNAELTMGGKITGFVKSTTGGALSGIKATLYDAKSEQSSASTDTDGGGEYSFNGLLSGNMAI
jgi:hypothetical protein